MGGWRERARVKSAIDDSREKQEIPAQETRLQSRIKTKTDICEICFMAVGNISVQVFCLQQHILDLWYSG